MARVQYSHPQRGINKTQAMVPPKKIADIDAWFKAARKVFPDIPRDWFRPEPIISEATIIFQLIDRKTHERCSVVIARKS